ncbi:hypothetical protein EDC94DRAFT_655216 [Helicostylum pulchrum]|nr:hypothetical protein EDC94DRAFT_655216 [Helicostylum pulchrum]
MGFFVTYLRKNFVLDNTKEYNVVSAFEASGHLDKNLAEMEFKDDIHSIARWSLSPLQQWALKESKTFEFWNSSIINQTLIAETMINYNNRYEQAIKTSRQEEETEDDGGSKESENVEEVIDDNEPIDIDFPSDISRDYHPFAEDGVYLFSSSIREMENENTNDWTYLINDEEFNIINELETFHFVSTKLGTKTLSDLRLL